MRTVAIFTCLACFALAAQMAEAVKFAPLAEIKPIGGDAVYFNPDKIIAVFQGLLVTARRSANPEAPAFRTGGITTYVAGLEDQPTPVGESPTAFLSSLSLGPLFVHLRDRNGDLYVRATAVQWISAPTGPTIDPGARAFVFAGRLTAGGTKVPFQVDETPDAVKALVDGVRARLSSARGD